MSFIFIPPVTEEVPKLNYWVPTIDDYPIEDPIDIGKFYPNETRLYFRELYTLKRWCKPDPRIPDSITTIQLVQFFIAADCHLIKGYELILRHYALANTMPEIFTGRNPIMNHEISNAWKVIKLASFPVLTPQGSRVFYTGLYNCKGKFNLSLHVKLFIMGVEASLLHEGIAPGGYSVIIDTREFPIFIAVGLLKPLLLKYLSYFLEGLQINVIDVHFLCYAGYNERMNQFHQYLSQEMYKKLHFHICGCPEMWIFYEFFPENCLPKDLNGTLPDDIHTLTLKMRRMIESSKLYFNKEEAQRRVMPLVNVNEMKKESENINKNRPLQKRLLKDYLKMKRELEMKMKYYKNLAHITQIKKQINIF